MHPAIRRNASNKVDDFVYVFTMAYDPLTNWSAHQIKIWGKHFPTVEHAFQFRKFTKPNPLLAKQIKAATSPREAKRIAHTKAVPSHWAAERIVVMKEIPTNFGASASRAMAKITSVNFGCYCVPKSANSWPGTINCEPTRRKSTCVLYFLVRKGNTYG